MSKKMKYETASAAVMPEDLELDRELARMHAAQDIPPEISDRAPVREVVRTEEPRELLSKVLTDTLPAGSDQELRDQVHLAKQHGCDSIEAESKVCERFCRDPLLKSVGYFVFQDIKVFIAGEVDRVSKRDNISIQHKVFGHS